MNFTEMAQNMVIGIVGGIYSSVIVSVAFFMLSEFQKELDSAKQMTSTLYELVSLGKIFASCKGKKDSDIMDAKRSYDSAINVFKEYEPWKFKHSMHQAMRDIYEVLTDGKYALSVWDESILSEVSKRIEEDLNVLEENEKHFGKNLAIRILGNRIILVMALVLIAAIIAA